MYTHTTHTNTPTCTHTHAYTQTHKHTCIHTYTLKMGVACATCDPFLLPGRFTMTVVFLTPQAGLSGGHTAHAGVGKKD